MGHRLDHPPQPGIGARHARMRIAIARAGQRHVDREYQGLDAGGLGAFQHIAHEAAILEHVELEPDRARALRLHFFERADRHGGKREGHAMGSRSARGLHFTAAGIHPGQPNRREHDRQGHVFAKQGGGGGQPAHVAQHVLADAQRLEIGLVPPQRGFRTRSAVDIVKQKRRQAPRGRATEIGGCGNDHLPCFLLCRVRRGRCGRAVPGGRPYHGSAAMGRGRTRGDDRL